MRDQRVAARARRGTGGPRTPPRRARGRAPAAAGPRSSAAASAGSGASSSPRRASMRRATLHHRLVLVPQPRVERDVGAPSFGAASAEMPGTRNSTSMSVCVGVRRSRASSRSRCPRPRPRACARRSACPRSPARAGSRGRPRDRCARASPSRPAPPARWSGSSCGAARAGAPSRGRSPRRARCRRGCVAGSSGRRGSAAARGAAYCRRGGLQEAHERASVRTATSSDSRSARRCPAGRRGRVRRARRCRAACAGWRRSTPSDTRQALHEAYAADAEGRNWTYLPYGPFASAAGLRARWSRRCRAQRRSASSTRSSTARLAAARRRRELPAHRARRWARSRSATSRYSPALQRTPAATEAMYLMMRRAFDELGYRRYEWKCDSLNAPSRARRRAPRLPLRGHLPPGAW